jgi:hypothetical protein
MWPKARDGFKAGQANSDLNHETATSGIRARSTKWNQLICKAAIIIARPLTSPPACATPRFALFRWAERWATRLSTAVWNLFRGDP